MHRWNRGVHGKKPHKWSTDIWHTNSSARKSEARISSRVIDQCQFQALELPALGDTRHGSLLSHLAMPLKSSPPTVLCFLYRGMNQNMERKVVLLMPKHLIISLTSQATSWRNNRLLKEKLSSTNLDMEFQFLHWWSVANGAIMYWDISWRETVESIILLSFYVNTLRQTMQIYHGVGPQFRFSECLGQMNHQCLILNTLFGSGINWNTAWMLHRINSLCTILCSSILSWLEGDGGRRKVRVKGIPN